MGLSGVSVSELAIVLLIVVLLFGTKHLKTLGSDLGGAIRGFRKAMNEKSPDAEATSTAVPSIAQTTAPAPDAARERTTSTGKR